MNNLPPGVRITDIPGNRPEDVRRDEIFDAFMSALPVGTEELRTALNKVLDSGDLAEIEKACYQIIEILDPPLKFVRAIEDAGRIAGEFENPPEPEWEPEMEMER